MISTSIAVLFGLAAIAVLAVAAAIHLYWSLGGRAGHALAVPERPRSGGGGPAMRPSPAGTLAVAMALAVAGDLVAVRIGLLETSMPGWVAQAACAALALAFLARAIGERRYVGFFKRVTGTRFARLDTMVYSPLCLFMAVATGINAL